MRLTGVTRFAVAATAIGAAVAFAPAAQAKSCADFDSQAQAQKHLRDNPRDPDNLDPDNNGIACENAPSPQDTRPVRHIDASGSTIPLRQDSPTTTPINGGFTTTTESDNPTTTRADDATTSTSEFDTTDATSTLNQAVEGDGVSAAAVVATLVGVALFGAIYVWFRRR